jgi:hypothetical protein
MTAYIAGAAGHQNIKSNFLHLFPLPANVKEILKRDREAYQAGNAI